MDEHEEEQLSGAAPRLRVDVQEADAVEAHGDLVPQCAEQPARDADDDKREQLADDIVGAVLEGAFELKDRPSRLSEGRVEDRDHVVSKDAGHQHVCRVLLDEE